MKKKFITKTISGLLSIVLLVTAIPTIPAKADSVGIVEKYPYTIFAASNQEGAITIDADNVCVNGSIATNGTIITDGNVNLNGKKYENLNEDMIYISDKLDSKYFSENVLFYNDYTIEETNINLNQPVEVLEEVSLTGNINLNTQIKALDDININGQVMNANNSVIYSAEGDIILDTDSVSLTGLVYAPAGDVRIEAAYVNLNSVVIIAQSVTIECSGANINYSESVAAIVGVESDVPEVEVGTGITAYGEYNKDTSNIDIEWFCDSESGTFEILESADNVSFVGVDIVENTSTYTYELKDDFEIKYFKVKLTSIDGEITESVPFVVKKVTDGYKAELLDTDEDGIPDIGEIRLNTKILETDSDKDGLTDYEEVYITETNPNVLDSVTEGVSDADADKDADGLDNKSEIKIGTKAYSVDTDEDGLTDAEEVHEYNTEPLLPDTDTDGLADADEIVLKTNPLLPDTDEDGVTD